ncbi:similar to Saccharomyces cerevisiae YDR132C Putative protein of unknown function [Maudiozyma saulgeensis]|uniref:BTB domain-containing protein n=1 Tax=Maudiozyma saulgeensis TaxID=1789683 RepID=A0A1X7R7Q5_9SACH|nr:similar to Saccharomyces cerevisiae YDR132C Putative protein of unknown function [Kazachstania saulgeensis]
MTTSVQKINISEIPSVNKSINYNNEKTNMKLPDDKIYTINMGTEVFKLTGLSFNSDSPNYFTEFFTKNDGKTDLFLDRNSLSFKRIMKHLQGYYLDIVDEDEYSMLLADSIFYGFNKLTTDIKESPYYYANIGGKSFKFLKKLFRRDGDSNNYFQVFSNTINSEIEYRFVNNKLSVVPISSNFVSRSPEYFQMLLDLLSGSTLTLSSDLRDTLIKECKYYRFQNLEQRLINVYRNTNPFSDVAEIKIQLNDINSKGLTSPIEKHMISQLNNHCMTNKTGCKNSSSQNGEDCDNSSNNSSDNENNDNEPERKKRKNNENQRPWDMVRYKRPFIDDVSAELIFQLNPNENSLIFNKYNKIIHMDITGNSLRTFDRAFNAFLSRQGITLNNYKRKFAATKGGKERDHLVLPACISISDLQVNGVQCRNICQLITDSKFNDVVYDVSGKDDKKYSPGLKLHLLKSLWKLGIKDGQIMLIAIKLDSFSGLKEFNKLTEFI